VKSQQIQMNSIVQSQSGSGVAEAAAAQAHGDMLNVLNGLRDELQTFGDQQQSTFAIISCLQEKTAGLESVIDKMLAEQQGYVRMAISLQKLSQEQQRTLEAMSESTLEAMSDRTKEHLDTMSSRGLEQTTPMDIFSDKIAHEQVKTMDILSNKIAQEQAKTVDILSDKIAQEMANTIKMLNSKIAQ